MKKFGFTLSEILITLGIIGVVAALTIPALMNKTNDLELKTAWKKDFSDISNILNLIKVERGNLDYSGESPAFQSFIDDFASHAAYTKKSYNFSNWHWTDTWYNLKGEPCRVNTSTPSIILKNGSIIQVAGNAGNPNTVELLVDVNGKKGPNMVGKDIYGGQFIQSIGVFKAYGTDASQNVISWNNAASNHCYQSPVPVGDPCDNLHVGWGCSATVLLGE